MLRFRRQIDLHAIKLLIFDLDGTVIDSREDLVQSVNAMLRHFQHSELPAEVVASYVGDGAPMLVRRALGGIPEALRQITANGSGRKLAVLSNKPVNPSRAIVEALGLRHFFISVYGGNSFETKKPDPLGVKTILRENEVPAEHAMIVGDSSIDVLTGRNAGIATCGVTYGFAPHTLCEVAPDVTVDSPRELGELFR
jgi:phosphoglycolate phosphatase